MESVHKAGQLGTECELDTGEETIPQSIRPHQAKTRVEDSDILSQDWEMAQRLRTLAALAQELGSVSSTCMVTQPVFTSVTETWHSLLASSTTAAYTEHRYNMHV